MGEQLDTASAFATQLASTLSPLSKPIVFSGRRGNDDINGNFDADVFHEDRAETPSSDERCDHYSW
jgi:hypothetical protein